MARARDPRVAQVMASLAGEHETILIARSDGLVAADVRPLVRMSLTVIVEENGRREQGYAGGGGRFDYALLHRRDARRATPSEAVDAGAAQPRRARRAGGQHDRRARATAGPASCCTRRSATASKATSTARARSAFSGRVGKRVAAKGVTVVDDGTIARRRGSLNIDDEGNPTQRTVLIEDGILQRLHAGPAQRAA